jgi:hypothetical protein
MRLLVYILVGVAVAALVAWWINRRNRLAAEQAERARVRSGANVTNDITAVRAGGVLKLPGFGRNTLGVETYVRERHRYVDAGQHPWYELVCDQAGRDLLVEWVREGGSLFATAGYEDENPTLEDLGLTEDDLIRFDEAGHGTFAWDGVTWTLEFARETDWFENDGSRKESFYRWEFHDPDDERWLTVEKWAGDNDFEVYHLWRIDPARVEVYDAGGEVRR